MIVIYAYVFFPCYWTRVKGSQYMVNISTTRPAGCPNCNILMCAQFYAAPLNSQDLLSHTLCAMHLVHCFKMQLNNDAGFVDIDKKCNIDAKLPYLFDNS